MRITASIAPTVSLWISPLGRFVQRGQLICPLSPSAGSVLRQFVMRSPWLMLIAPARFGTCENMSESDSSMYCKTSLFEVHIA